MDVYSFLSSDYPILDVRSPSEFKEGHIPGAISFPLFSDDERAIIGTIYKQEGKNSAIRKGFEIVGPRMAQMVVNAEQLGAGKFRVHCWRGGMRSENVAWLLQKCGMNTTVLTGGYKSYRQAQIEFFEKEIPLKVLSGYTGSKKTIILHKLKELGEQVIDLEGLANHQGSSFGNKKSTGQPTTEQFQNNLFNEFLKLDLNKPVWIEDESMKIGRVNMHESLYKLKSKSPHYVIDAPMKQRVSFLVSDYGEVSPEKLIAATNSISKKLGKENSELAIEAITNGNLSIACEIILTYYDKRYQKSLERKSTLIINRYNTDLENIDEVVTKLIHEN